MSDLGPEAPPPPPPPPDLAPPPGYTAYTPNLSAATPLRRVGGLRTTILVLLGIFAIASVVQVVSVSSVVDSSKDFLARTISEDAYKDDLAAYGLVGMLTGVLQLALSVLSIVWLFRIVKNHRSIGRRLTWAPGWAIGSWFLPPTLFILPTLVLRETWKAADPDVAPGDDRWRSGPVNPLLWVWFAVYVVGSAAIFVVGFRQQFSAFGGDVDDSAKSLADGRAVLIAQGVVGVLGAVTWGLLVRAWTDRHTRLTGEALGR